MASPMPSMANALMARPDQGPGRFGPAAAPAPAGNLRLPPQGPTPPANALVSPPPGPIMPPQLPSVVRPVPRSREGLADRISTRVPTHPGLAYDPHDRPLPDLSVNGGAMLPEGHGAHHFTEGHDEAKKAIGEHMHKHAELIRDKYPFIDTSGLTNGGVLERFVEHAHHNIVDMWHRTKGEPWRDQAIDAHRAANRIATDIAQRHGVSQRQAAAAMAMLPQKDEAPYSNPQAVSNAVREIPGEDHLPTISRALGADHRVRNLYNNIVAPDAAAFLKMHHHDVAVDRHAINAALMMPHGETHPMGEHNEHTGAHGLYGLHADAYRRAAQTISQQEGRQYLPREVQSVASEGARRLWPEEHRKLDEHGMPAHESGKAALGAAYAVRHGFMPPMMARNAVVQAARMPPPPTMPGASDVEPNPPG